MSDGVKIDFGFGRFAFGEAKTAIEAGGEPEGGCARHDQRRTQIAALYRRADLGFAVLDEVKERASAAIAADDRAGSN